jgi:hypothetical protein
LALGLALNTFTFISLHALIFVSSVMVFFGLGAMVCWQDLKSKHQSNLFRFAWMCAVGLGVSIFLLQILAIFGMLNLVAISAFAALGAGGAVIAFRKWSYSEITWCPPSPAEKVAYLILIAVILRTVLMPFRPATSWDEVMYHLPHALQWAESGTLSVNAWLRFPWFPYNYDLLYAMALLIWDDVLAHLFHALAGWLCALMIYQVGSQLAGRIQAAISTGIWITLSNFYYGNAYIDLGLSLFVFTACVAFWLWTGAPKERTRWLFMAAFLLGVAAGSKYLPLIYLPLFLVGLLVIERRYQTILLSALFFLLPCVYWYARNLIFTGDPFNPFGGPIFGFFDWNAGDYAGQFIYARSHSGWPPWLLWPALVVPFMRSSWEDFNWRLITIFSVYSVVLWYFSTGGYVRFLTSAFPVLAIMSARGWVYLVTTAGQKIGQFAPGSWSRPGRTGSGNRWVFLAFTLVLAGLTSEKLIRDWNHIQVSAVERNAYLQEKITGYDVIARLSELPHTGIYQFGLEEATFYMPQPVWGDHFGPGRYQDMAALTAEGLAEKLNSMGIDVLVIRQSHWPQIEARIDFHHYFEEMMSSKGVTAYRLRSIKPDP